MAIAKLSIDLEARLANLQAGLDKAGLLAERQAKRIEGAFSGIARVGSALGATLGGAFAVGGLTAFVRSTIAGLDALNDFADATGTSIELASALEDVAVRTGTSFDTVQTSVLRLNKVLSDAKPGSDAAETLKLIGLNAEELKRLDPAEALRRTAVALAQFADDGNKARVVQDLFGKSVAQVAPLLKDLAESGQLNATVTTEQAKAAERFNIQLAELQKNVVDLSRDIVGGLLPALNQFFERIKASAALDVGFGTKLAEVLKGNTFEDAGKGVTFYTEKLGALQRQREVIASDSNPIAKRGGLIDVDAEISDVKKLLSFYRTLQAQGVPQADFSNEGRAGVRQSIGGVPGGGGGGGKAAKATKEFTLIGPGLDDASLAAIKALETTDVARVSALRDQLQQLIAIRGGTSDTARIDEALANTVDQLVKLDPAAQAAAASAERLKAILASTPSGQLAGVLDDVKVLNEALAAGQITYEQWGEAARTATARAGAQAEQEIQKISTFADQAGRNIHDALGDSLEQVLRGNFDSIGQLWSDLLIRMAAQAAAAQLNQFLFGSLFGGTGGGSGALGGAIGELFKSSFGGFFANGGTLGAGRWGIAGEAGPELIKGPATIVPASKLSGSGPVVNITNVFQGEIGPATLRLVEGSMQRVKADILRSSRTGGAYAGSY
jgi:hypothetical protein